MYVRTVHALPMHFTISPLNMQWEHYIYKIQLVIIRDFSPKSVCALSLTEGDERGVLLMPKETAWLAPNW
jgi:hypothetical protein